MPFINTKTNICITEEQELSLKTEFGKAISLIGKSEPWLMLGFEDNCRMYFQGDNQSPAAFVEVKLYGKASKNDYANLTARLTEIIAATLSVPANRIYIKYEEVDHWGWNGANF